MASDNVRHLESLINQGRYFEARAILDQAVDAGSSLRLHQLYALSLSKSGAPQTAMTYLEPVAAQHPDDSETAGILGGIYKELFKKNHDTSYALKSKEQYLRNFEKTYDTYTGVNAASMSLIAGSAAQAKRIAATLISKLDQQSKDPWTLATLGEAHLLTKDREHAVEYYLKAREEMGGDWGKVATVYNQLWLLNHYTPVPGQILNAFAPPCVAAFVGHMIDKRGRANSRFPPDMEGAAREAMVAAVRTLNVKIGYCSLACGGDILFAEAVAGSGGELEIYLPFEERDFVNASVRYAGESWVARFEHLARRFQVHLITREAYLGNDDLFALGTRVVFGSAIQRAHMLHTDPRLVSLLSVSEIQAREGGTRHTLNAWPLPSNQTIINIDTLRITGESNTSIADPLEEDGPPAQRSANRFVRYVVMLVPEQATGGASALLDRVIRKNWEDLTGDKTIEARDDHYLMTLEHSDEAIRLSWALLDQFDAGTLPGQCRMLLHVVPVVYEEHAGGRSSRIQNEEHFAGHIKSMFQPNVLYATRQATAVLTLNLNMFVTEFAGVMYFDASNQEDIFSVGRSG